MNIITLYLNPNKGIIHNSIQFMTRFETNRVHFFFIEIVLYPIFELE